MKWMLPVLLLLPFAGLAQRSMVCSVSGKKLLLEEGSLYLFCRGTATKGGGLARSFNTKDSLITHVGIGSIKDNRLYIYSVVDRRGNALQVDSLASYLTKDSYYFSVWRSKLTVAQLNKLDLLLQEYVMGPVTFDFEFTLSNDLRLYCSEFCYWLLNRLDKAKFDFTPVQKMLTDPFQKIYLGRSTLTYIPVDFFLQGKAFTKVFETGL